MKTKEKWKTMFGCLKLVILLLGMNKENNETRQIDMNIKANHFQWGFKAVLD